MTNKKERSPINTTVTISCTSELRDLMKQAANAQKRTVSNWVCVVLEDYFRAQSVPVVAEKPAEYRTAKK